MNTATKLVFEFARKGHPLGKNILEEDVPIMTSQLRKRVSMSEDELDFSPPSLKRLEDKLVEMYELHTFKEYNEEEILRFVREIAAYVGGVMIAHAQGKWEALGSLWSTHIVIEGEVKINKGGKQQRVPSVAISLGNIGAATWDLLSLGKEPILYKEYLKAKRKKIKEQL